MTYNEIWQMVREGKVSYHHSATARGYRGVNQGVAVIPYTGRFGTGYKALIPNLQGKVNGRTSNRYYRIEYYINNQ